MGKRLTIFLLACFLGYFSNLKGQRPECRPTIEVCRPTPTVPVCLTPKVLDEGTVGIPYSSSLNLNIGLQAISQGRTFNITAVEILGVTNLPAGLSIAFLSANSNHGNNGVISNFPARLAAANTPYALCASITGTPSAPTQPTDSVTIQLRLNLSIGTGGPSIGIPVPVNVNFHVPIKNGIIVPVFRVDAGADRTITCGAQTQLQATVTPPQTQGVTFSWSPTTGLSNPNIANPVARPTVTTTYVVTAASETLGLKASDTVVVFVNKANFNLNFTANPTVITEAPYTTTFTIANFSRGLQYTLFPGDGNSIPLFTNTFAYTYSDTGVYSPMLVARNLIGCTDTLLRRDYIRVESPLLVFVNPSSTTITCGSITRATATTNKTGNIEWSWEPTTGVSNPNIANPSLSPTQTTIYTITARLDNQKASTTMKVVVEGANFNVNFTANPTNLTTRPFTVNFTNSTPSSSNYTYTWDFGDGNTSNQVNPRHTYQNNGTYTVQLIATDPNTGCKDTLTRVGYIVCDDRTNAPLTVTVTNDTAINCGDRVQLEAKANLPNTTFQWAPTTGLNNPNIANPVATPPATTTYTVTARNGIQLARAVVVVTIKPVEITNLEAEYCTTSPAFQITASVPGGTYSGPVNGLTPQGLFTPSQAGPGNYTIRYSGTRNGCSFTTSKPVRVVAPPTATIEGLANRYCNNSPDVPLKLSPEGGRLSVEYAFSIPGAPPISGGINGTSFSPSTLAPGNYRVRYTGTSGICTYNTVSNPVLVVAAPQVRISGLNSTYCQNDPPSTMTAEPAGGVFSGSGVSGNTFNPAEATLGKVDIIYKRDPTNPNECPAIDTVTVTVFPTPDFVFIFTRPSPGQSNGSITINATGGTPPFQYKLNDGNFQNSNVFNNLPAGTYEATVRDANGCTHTRTLNLTPNCPSFTIRASGPTSFCSGPNNFVLLSLNPPPAPANTTYQWQRDGVNLPGQNAASTQARQSGAYRLIVRVPFCPDTATNVINVTVHPLPVVSATVTDATGANNADGQIVARASNGQAPYQFRLGTTGNFQNDSVFRNLRPNTYTITARDARGCTSTAVTFTVSVKIICPNPTITTENALEFCAGGEAILRADIGEGFSYQWLKDNTPINGATNQTLRVTETGNYSVIIKKNGCEDVRSEGVIVSVSPVPGLTYTVENPLGNLQNGKIVARAVGGTEPYEYALGNGSFTPNGTFDNLGAGSYVLRVKDSKGCQAETTAVLNSTPVNCPTSAQITASGPLAFCQGGNVELSANTGTDYIYVWRRDGQLISEARGSRLTVAQSGSYSLSITRLGCADSAYAAPVNVAVHPLPQLSTTVTSAVNGNNGVIQAAATGGTAPYQFQLNNQAFQSSGTFRDLAPGNYIVRVRDSKGCQAQAQVTVESTTVTEYTVWPGDANNDGVVDVTDYFIIASGFGKTGPPRTEKGSEWRGYKANILWPSTTNYRGTTINDLYLDANGDGVIDMQDVDLTKQYRGRERR
ncbi:MAG: PKD domain-containing protein [Bacteroidia bacterium]|nr:PKD domain-containing protein [Bacteroidia bacterium]MDW8157817.1 PKD domain-containing protein [Bacteroidia bacterium]